MSQHFFFCIICPVAVKGCGRKTSPLLFDSFSSLCVTANKQKKRVLQANIWLCDQTHTVSNQSNPHHGQTESPPALTEENTVSAKCVQMNGGKRRSRWAGRMDAAVHRLYLYNTETNKICSHCLTTRPSWCSTRVAETQHERSRQDGLLSLFYFFFLKHNSRKVHSFFFLLYCRKKTNKTLCWHCIEQVVQHASDAKFRDATNNAVHSQWFSPVII